MRFEINKLTEGIRFNNSIYHYKVEGVPKYVICFKGQFVHFRFWIQIIIWERKRTIYMVFLKKLVIMIEAKTTSNLICY